MNSIPLSPTKNLLEEDSSHSLARFAEASGIRLHV